MRIRERAERMSFIALKMLFGDRAKYLGIVIGLTFASLLITQQSAIFAGMMTRTFSFLTDVALPDIWVVDPQVKYIDDIRPMQDTEVLRVRGVEGVQWAVPLYKGSLAVRRTDGTYQSCVIIGLDDETLMGGPPTMLMGKMSDLRQSGGVIVDITGAEGKLAHVQPNGTRVPLKVGDEMEINDNRSVVVGICKVTQTFQANPVIYTTYSSATSFAPSQRLMMSFVTVKAKAGQDLRALCQRIEKATALRAYTRDEFKMVTFPSLTTAENVATPLIINGMKPRAAVKEGREMLAQVGFDERMMSSLPTALSGGQQQRVAIARALVHQPRLIVCDEPTSALDGETGHKVMELLHKLGRAEGRALVVVTHDSRIYDFADRIAAMEDGRITQVVHSAQELKLMSEKPS
jgi:ABC-type polar amino acid transport system ATPase subunit